MESCARRPRNTAISGGEQRALLSEWLQMLFGDRQAIGNARLADAETLEIDTARTNRRPARTTEGVNEHGTGCQSRTRDSSHPRSTVSGARTLRREKCRRPEAGGTARANGCTECRDGPARRHGLRDPERLWRLREHANH